MVGWRIIQHYYCFLTDALAETVKYFYQVLLTKTLLLQLMEKAAGLRVKSGHIHPFAFTRHYAYCFPFLLPGVRQTRGEGKTTFIIIADIQPTLLLELFQLTKLLLGLGKALFIPLLFKAVAYPAEGIMRLFLKSAEAFSC